MTDIVTIDNRLPFSEILVMPVTEERVWTFLRIVYFAFS